MKCLIADDDPRIRQMLKSILERPGMEFLEAQDGGAAVAMYQAHRPDFVIMDVEMEPMDGITATRIIRQWDARCRVLVLSQHDSSGFRHAAASAGAFGYVLKDDLQAVLDVLAEHIWPKG
jgi:CheY-like chemotaxis protein